MHLAGFSAKSSGKRAPGRPADAHHANVRGPFQGRLAFCGARGPRPTARRHPSSHRAVPACLSPHAVRHDDRSSSPEPPERLPPAVPRFAPSPIAQYGRAAAPLRTQALPSGSRWREGNCAWEPSLLVGQAGRPSPSILLSCGCANRQLSLDCRGSDLQIAGFVLNYRDQRVKHLHARWLVTGCLQTALSAGCSRGDDLWLSVFHGSLNIVVVRACAR
jgi:hypothetical protein